MDNTTVACLKDKIVSNIDNLLDLRQQNSNTLSYSGENDCSKAVQNYCMSLVYLSNIKEGE